MLPGEINKNKEVSMKKVDIQKIVNELEMRFMDTTVYYNKITSKPSWEIKGDIL